MSKKEVKVERIKHGEFSAEDKVTVQLPSWKRPHKGIVKEQTAKGYTVEFNGKVYRRNFRSEELSPVQDGWVDAET
jgi:hypothetical protein